MKLDYVNQNVNDFIDSLAPKVRSKVDTGLALLEEFGPNVGFPFTKKLFTDLWELRIRSQLEIRFLYTVYDSKIILIHGFIKKSQKTPLKELKTAYKRLLLLKNI